MVKQPNEVKPVEKTAAPKKEKKKPLQEIYGEGEKDQDGFDEEHGDEQMKTFLEYSSNQTSIRYH